MNSTFDMCSSERSYFNRHCGKFDFDPNEYPKYDGHFHFEVYSRIAVSNVLNALANKGLPQAPIIKIFTCQVQPYLFALRNNNSLTLYGPIFSVVSEVAKYLNYRCLHYNIS